MTLCALNEENSCFSCSWLYNNDKIFHGTLCSSYTNIRQVCFSMWGNICPRDLMSWIGWMVGCPWILNKLFVTGEYVTQIFVFTKISSAILNVVIRSRGGDQNLERFRRNHAHFGMSTMPVDGLAPWVDRPTTSAGIFTIFCESRVCTRRPLEGFDNDVSPTNQVAK